MNSERGKVGNAAYPELGCSNQVADKVCEVVRSCGHMVGSAHDNVRACSNGSGSVFRFGMHRGSEKEGVKGEVSGERRGGLEGVVD
jgi:hypothetical protein